MGSAGRGCTRLVRAAQRLAERSTHGDTEVRRRRSGGTGRQAAAGCEDPGQAQHLVRAVWRGPRRLYRRYRDRFEGPHRIRSAGPDFAAHRAPCTGRCGADQAAEPLQAGRGAQVGGAGVRRLLSRPAQERYRGVPEVLAVQGQWRSDAGNPRGSRRCGGGAFAAPAQHQGCDLRAIGRLGCGRGRGLHQAVRDELHAVRAGQPLSKSASPPGEGLGAPQETFRIAHDERVATRQSWGTTAAFAAIVFPLDAWRRVRPGCFSKFREAPLIHPFGAPSPGGRRRPLRWNPCPHYASVPTSRNSICR
ncbi:hypothetical protein XFF6990_240074 [Xanthomonas citri pv. fuscans]|nr:hypothetical protein XFF6990_240074 [Xanthomonas citri pv. fuscans]